MPQPSSDSSSHHDQMKLLLQTPETGGVVVARYQVFVLTNGSFAVQWRDSVVQELLTGQYRDYEQSTDFGYSVTDYELSQLQATGFIAQYDQNHVWFHTVPQNQNLPLWQAAKRVTLRAYYLSSLLPETEFGYLKSAIQNAGFADRFEIRARQGFIIVLGQQGAPFVTIEDAEAAQRKLYYHIPRIRELFAIGFVESKHDATSAPQYYDPNGTNVDLGDLMASQEDTSMTEGKTAVLVVRQDDERQAIESLLKDMQMDVHHAKTGREAILLLEDMQCDFLVADIQLSDMHTWKMLGTLKESYDVSSLPIIVFMNEPTVVPLENITSVVRPVAMARLRHIIWNLFKAKKQASIDSKSDD